MRRSLDSLQEGDTLGVFIDKKSRLHLLINGEDLGPIAQAIPARRFAVLDLYGCCEEVSIVTADHGERGRVSMEEAKAERSSGKELFLCVNCIRNFSEEIKQDSSACTCMFLLFISSPSDRGNTKKHVRFVRPFF